MDRDSRRGAFESPFLAVVELDVHGKAVRLDFYDPHHLDDAIARFAELAAPTRSEPLKSPFANAASATVDPVNACLVAHD